VWGGLRIGWVRADRELVSLLIAARPARDLGTPEFEQAVAARVVERMPDVLAQRAQLLGKVATRPCGHSASGCRTGASPTLPAAWPCGSSWMHR
jgi:hypothetical protein